MDGVLLLLPNLTGGSHLLAEIDGWHATRATRSYEGPEHMLKVMSWPWAFVSKHELDLLYEVLYIIIGQEVAKLSEVKVGGRKKSARSADPA